MEFQDERRRRRQDCNRRPWELGSSDSNYEPSSDYSGPVPNVLLDGEQHEDGEEEDLSDTMTWRMSICQMKDASSQTR
eukprot:12191487-Prorocentrum_lima.AAC.1